MFTRYQSVADSVNALRNKGEKFKILEVGGRGNHLRSFLPNDHITILDVIDCEDENYIKGDGRSLPFKKKSFDIIVSTDVLEHIPGKDREKFLKEQFRVSKKAIILAGPTNEKWIEKAEKESNNYYKSLSGVDHPWLVEHMEYILPSRELIEDTISSNKASWSVWYNQTPDLWEELNMVDMLVGAISTPKTLAALKKLNKIYNQDIFKFDRGKNGYRSIYTIMTDGSEAPEALIHKTLIDLPLDKLVLLSSAITDVYRSAEAHFLGVIGQLSTEKAKTESVKDENKRLKETILLMSADINRINGRIRKIESSFAYRIWRAYKKILNH